MMSKKTNIRHVNELISGDVLLCHIDASLIAQQIEKATGSKYSHAAIYYGDGFVAESLIKEGLGKGQIVKNAIRDVISRYDHIAVIRQPDAWCSEQSIAGLKLFIDKTIENGAKYNLGGIFSFTKRKELHETNVHQKLVDFFANESIPISPNKENYFCSEFVADCFIATGFIQPSAAILFQSDTYSPGDLGKEPTFGTFFGYLTNNPSYEVKEEDYYYHASTFDEIFGNP